MFCWPCTCTIDLSSRREKVGLHNGACCCGGAPESSSPTIGQSSTSKAQDQLGKHNARRPVRMGPSNLASSLDGQAACRVRDEEPCGARAVESRSLRMRVVAVCSLESRTTVGVRGHGSDLMATGWRCFVSRRPKPGRRTAPPLARQFQPPPQPRRRNAMHSLSQSSTLIPPRQCWLTRALEACVSRHPPEKHCLTFHSGAVHVSCHGPSIAARRGSLFDVLVGRERHQPSHTPKTALV